MFISVRRLFVCCSLYEFSVSPSLWCFSIVALHHAKHLFHKFGFDLGINTMEGREQKHQQIIKYSKSTTYQNPWADIFRHKYRQLIYLIGSRFDLKKYQHSKTTYIPKHKIGLFEYSLPLIYLHCEVCYLEREIRFVYFLRVKRASKYSAHWFRYSIGYF